MFDVDSWNKNMWLSERSTKVFPERLIETDVRSQQLRKQIRQSWKINSSYTKGKTLQGSLMRVVFQLISDKETILYYKQRFKMI